MILAIISLIVNSLALYLHLTTIDPLAFAIMIVYMVPLYSIGAITSFSSLMSSIFKKFKPVRLTISLISLGISLYGLISLFV